MILTTTPTVEGRTISEYMRVIGGETVIGINLYRSMNAGYNRPVEIAQARDAALNELWKRGEELGADGVISVAIDYEPLGPDGGAMLVSATGTAVKLA
ncbi:hypothetical protein CKJ85_09245 [Corynebacterium sp. NML 150383]|uniref:heavy metal-binding domain-containing protein n=1 Tax=Corynebacterium sp. NML 150383 TaxID=2029400 RepID=UPI000BAA6864|nr:heavy metal-binding domain-containing protein [Corynebacterium sp. NML 150383]PAT03160.1 hypothetical protein CKJ85_09245 [Corynebacterium sp. NML 150383]